MQKVLVFDTQQRQNDTDISRQSRDPTRLFLANVTTRIANLPPISRRDEPIPRQSHEVTRHFADAKNGFFPNPTPTEVTMNHDAELPMTNGLSSVSVRYR